ncbi:MAG: hypothetical protein DRQ55_13990 [Planctomycetota bacterium]|nr:MAG: hypothetical protein DRQ55_13990 [Planctomycetota bacterium]
MLCSLRLALPATCLAFALASPLAAQTSAAHGQAQLPELPIGLTAPAWESAFGGEPGVGRGDGGSVFVFCSAVYDDGLGDGPVLFVGGRFETAGGLPMSNLARWDGSGWSNPGGTNNDVYALAVHNDGSGEKLYAGGLFSTVGGISASRLARYDGATWEEVDGGVNGNVYELHRFFDGADLLAIGGEFTLADGAPANRAALLWAGELIAFGAGFNDRVNAFAIHDGEIYAGGEFTESDGVPMTHLARWTGSEWEDVDGGVGTGSFSEVNSLASWGTGAAYGLYVGGRFEQVGTLAVPAISIARWQAGSWSAVDGGVSNSVEDFVIWDDGGGEDLYLSGNITWMNGSYAGRQHLIRWDGTSLTTVGFGLQDTCHTLSVHDDGSGESLWLGGQFSLAGVRGANGVGRWDGSDYWPTDEGINDEVLTLHSSSSFLGGPTLFVGGSFAVPGTAHDRGIGAWQDGAWIPMGAIFEDYGDVFAITEFNDGSGLKLYVGGTFTTIGGVSATRIARWDGSSWSGVGGGLDGWCLALEVFDDGSGAALYAAGTFDVAGGTSAEHIARWDGVSWTALGLGIDSSQIHDMQVYNDGSGNALYLTGNFDAAGGSPAVGIAKWDGSSWSALGAGLTTSSGTFGGTGRSLEVFDDGTGPKLYVAGQFTEAGGAPDTYGVAAWDGTSWSGLSSPVSAPYALAAFDDGSGKSLFVGGFFDDIGGTSYEHIARWNGAGWAAAGSGVVGQHVRCLEVFDDGSSTGPRLVVGGAYNSVPDTLPTGGSRLAYWNGGWDAVDNWTDLGFALAGVSGDPLLEGFGSLTCGSINDVNLSNAAPSALSGLFIAFSSTPTPFAGGTLIPVPFLDPILLNTSATGDIPISFVMPAAPPGTEIYVQWAISDVAAVAGVSLSNALRGDVP